MKYTAENFHLHYIPHYQLLIKSDFTTDTLIVLDESLEVQALYAYPSQTPDTDATKLLGLPFQDIAISLPLQSFTLVPSEVYDSRRMEHYQAFVQDEQLNRTQAEPINGLDITGVFQFDLFLHKRWSAIFPQAKFLADFQVVLATAQRYLPETGQVLGIHAKDKQVDLFVFQGKELQFYNIFDVEQVADLQYFVLNVCKNLGLTDQFSQVLLSGVTAEHPFMAVAQRHGKTVQLMQAHVKLHSNEPALQAHINSLNLMADFRLCVS